MKSVTDVWAVTERHLEQGDAAFVADLGMALVEQRRKSTERVWQYESVVDHALRLLATTPGQGNVVQTLRLVHGDGREARKRARYVASLLASSQEPQDLAIAFRGGRTGPGASDELRGCLVHEVILRGTPVTEIPEVMSWAISPHWSHHSLAWLPLTLSAMEEGADLPSYSVRGSSHAMPFGPQGELMKPLPLRPGGVAAEEVRPDGLRRASAAVDNWAEESNGRIEGRAFDLAHPVADEDVPTALMSLPLECLSGITRRTSYSVTTCAVGPVWRVLFSAASTGGAYNHGLYGAYGRLAAWRSLAGMTSTPADSPAAAIDERATSHSWFRFNAATDWYWQVAWDIGLVAISAERTRMTVLAATDTD